MNNSVYNNNNRLFSASIVSTFLKGSTLLDPNRSDTNANPQSSLSIYNAFTGVKVTAPFDIFNNMDSFKVYIAQVLKIDIERLFLLTPFGIKLKFSMIVHEQINEVFAFDRKFFNPMLVRADRKDAIINELLSTIVNDELIFMIKPREPPILNANMDSFIKAIEALTYDSEEIRINSSDLDFDSLRLLLNLLKRNSGWASALLSDMKSALFNNVYYRDYEIVENILRALNSLIQYVSNLFVNLENEFNAVLDTFNNLKVNSLSDKWESCFGLLEKISFSYTDKSTKQQRTLNLSDLINLDQTIGASKKSKILSKKINKFFGELRSLVENDIIKQKENIINEYESYKALYLKPEWEISERETMIKSKDIFLQLESHVNEMTSDSDRLPSFEELITTSSQLSTYLSQDAIKKIMSLVGQYRSQRDNYVKQITSLANELYEIQHKYSAVREELQKKVVRSMLFGVVQIQLSIRDATKLLNSELASNIELLQNSELQLSLVVDLPLLFGIWVIALLGNIKYGLSLKKISRKSNEVFEMLNYIERNNRTKWLEEFIEGIGVEKADSIFLSDNEYKNKFILENLFQFHLTSDDGGKINSTPTIKRQSSDTSNYLASFNKIIQNFNGFPNKSHQLDTIPSSTTVYNDLLKNSSISYFEGLLTSVTMKDIMDYLKCLENSEYKTSLLNQLKTYMKDMGLDEPIKLNTNKEKSVLYKSGNIDDLGSFDYEDQHYMKIFKKFIKSFESSGVTIELKIGTQKAEKPPVDTGLVRIYEERIQKLENLLHEKRFQQFNNRWSQTNSNTPIVNVVDNSAEEKIVASSSGVLGRKTIKLPPSHYTEKIQQLERENQRLNQEVEELKTSQVGEEITKMKREMEVNFLQVKNYQAKLDDNARNLEEKDKHIEGLQQQIEKLLEENKGLENKNYKLNSDITELNILNKDLLENMSHKENELMSENQLNQKEKNDLKLRIEELLDIKNQYDRVMDKVKDTDGIINNVLSILSFAFNKLRDLSKLVYGDMETFCLILEIMGLLLVDEKNGMEIKRVKGLRYTKKDLFSKKSSIDEVDDDMLFLEVVASDLINDSRSKLEWLPQMEEKLEELKGFSYQSDKVEFGESESVENTNEKLHSSKIKEIEGIFESLNNYDVKLRSVIEVYSEADLEEKYNEFIKHTLIEHDLILGRVHKRFEDVESLARKLQKEKVKLKGEIKSLTKKVSQQLVLRNFQNGDLVLFLKTLVPVTEGANTEDAKKQPWAVFNIGSPNYYLKSSILKDLSKLEEKEWFVGRIKNIEEYAITEENKDSIDKNPFNLNVGTKWYYVETKDDSIV